MTSKKDKPIIEVKHLSKEYRIGMDRTYKRFSESFTNAVCHPLRTLRETTQQKDSFWALKDVNFEVERGEVLGIIGRNGAGKSTLLKILSRITYPTEGEIVMRGRVGSLLEVGTGFHPELTGRENIYFNGAILGMKKREIEEKFDEIVKFSGVEKFLDTPVKRYSSGMNVRLAFSVAAHLDPEILLVDEVLAVGDAEFQKKCLGKMGEVASEGRTVLFVSHNMAAVENLCSRSLLLHNGIVSFEGGIHGTIERYLSLINSNESIGNQRCGPITMSVSIYSQDVLLTNNIKSGDYIKFVIEFSSDYSISNTVVGLGICTSFGQRIVTFHTKYQCSNSWFTKKKCMCTIEWPENFLSEGTYIITTAVYDGNSLLASWDQIASLTITASDYFGTGKIPDNKHQGYVMSRCKWSIKVDSDIKCMREIKQYI